MPHQTIRSTRYKALPLISFAGILLITLYFGLKPKGFRFINQVKMTGTAIVFSNIGMAYTKGTLGEIGITDSLCLRTIIKPYRTGRRLSRIFAVINEKGYPLLTLDQWQKGVELTLWNGAGSRIVKTGIGKALSRNGFRVVTAGVTRHELFLTIGDTSGTFRRRPITLPEHHFRNGRLLIGLSTSGSNPWRGEMAALALYPQLPDTQILPALNSTNASNTNTMIQQLVATRPPVMFLFNQTVKKTIKNGAGSQWDLTIPKFTRLFRHVILSTDFIRSRSFLADMIINFAGFLPFGLITAFILKKKLRNRAGIILLTSLIAGMISLSIEMAQVFIPTRTSQLIDVFLNIGGAGAGAIIFLMYHHIFTAQPR